MGNAIIEHPTPEQQRETWRVYRRALKRGELQKPSTCSWCGREPKKLHGHHPDYARPLMVVWLCPTCHSQHHATYASERGLFND